MMDDRIVLITKIEVRCTGLPSCRPTKSVGLLNHSVKHGSDALPGFVQLIVLLFIYVIACEGVIKPGLGFPSLRPAIHSPCSRTRPYIYAEPTLLPIMR